MIQKEELVERPIVLSTIIITAAAALYTRHSFLTPFFSDRAKYNDRDIFK
jgi:hypothetical protein